MRFFHKLAGVWSSWRTAGAALLVLLAASGATQGLAQPPPPAPPVVPPAAPPTTPAPVAPGAGPAAPPPGLEDCAACHGLTKDAAASIGPNLWGVGGRKAGTTNYDYSPAMKAYGAVWTPETLAPFIQSPMTVVPGTTMAYPGQPDPAAAKAIADYLMTLKDEGAPG